MTHAFVRLPESVVDMFRTSSDWLDDRGIPPLIIVAAVVIASVQLILIVILMVRCFIQTRSRNSFDDHEKFGADYFLIDRTKTSTRTPARRSEGEIRRPGSHARRSTSEPCMLTQASLVLANPPTPSVRRFTLQPGTRPPGKKPRRTPFNPRRGVSMKEEESSAVAEKRTHFAIRASQSTPQNLFRDSMDGPEQSPGEGRGDEAMGGGTALARGGVAAPTSLPSLNGMILFAVTYDRDLEQVKVFVDQARQLRSKSPEGVAVTFVKVALIPEQRIPPSVSRVARKSANPVYRHSFVFRVSPDSVKELVVRIQVFELDNFSHNDPVGELEYPLSQHLNLDTPDLIWRDLQVPPKVENVTKGEVLFSLTYLPNAEKVNLIVLKARNLKSPGLGKQTVGEDVIDTFVKVTLVKSGKVIKYKQTRVCRKSSQPVYNEGFSLKVRQSDLDEVSITLAVCIRLNHLGFHRVIGRCIVGRHVGGDGTSHWRDMINAPRSGVGQWHALV